jgi:four helix bundle protein
MIKQFEDIVGWQKGQDLAVSIYSNFRECKDWDFRNQICRAAVSISNNIAEGFTRNSDKEFARFLNIALASNSEVKSMIYLAIRLNYLSAEIAKGLFLAVTEISKIISGLIKSLKI